MNEANNFSDLMNIVGYDMGFDVAQALLEMSQEDRDEFGQYWIETARDNGGLSRDDLEKVGKSIAAPIDDAELCKWVEADDLFAGWNALLTQIEGSKIALVQDGIWGFVLQVPNLGEFAFPYQSIAMTVCNRLIQYGTERNANGTCSVGMTS